MKTQGAFFFMLGIFLILASLYCLFNCDFEWWVGALLGLVIVLGVINIGIGGKLMRGK